MCLCIHGGALACGRSKDPAKQPPGDLGWTVRKSQVTCRLCKATEVYQRGVPADDGALALPGAPAEAKPAPVVDPGLLPGIDF